MKSRAHKYDRRGVLAIYPQAFFEFFFAPPAPVANVEIGDVTVVDIRGPLDQHDEGWCDSYEAIERRVTAACESACKAIVLRIDSPGGEAAGCFEAARSLRVLCEAADKPLYAFVDGKACSAAYALACAAQQISLGDTALVGSIGVLSCRDDYSAMNAARGLRVAFITSGSRKADGHPDAPITEAELKESQAIVDSMAGVFFDLVAEMRGLQPKAIAGLDARIFHGDAAITAGLADDITTFDELLAAVAAGETDMKLKSEKTEDKSPYESARAALEEAAKGDDANAAAAKRALAAMDEGNEPGGDEKKDGDGDGDKEKTEADDDKKDDGDKEAPKEGASAHVIAVQALAEVHKLRAERGAEKEAEERGTLIASRADFAPELVAVLQDKATPIATVRKMVAELPKGKVIPKPAATTTVPATRGQGQGEGEGSRLPPGEKTALDAMMGLHETELGVVQTENKLVLGAIVPKASTKPTPAAPPAAR